ncbi:5-hydroxyisourate hydrolase precursor [Actinomadura rubteroloni]|uniref:5-hydroxyisourate hydrolase n=1 Tax=Actinomadura rubteroloni TaxID=1926885 RepID=A0A2P4UI18_9ACTN|nr:hydroxyisourate hydrolase [Actinomadura rubteroloni]POM24702.1 5-hydroxyisourate hydrolase precursor [Actinomadura rubteroloni]
MTLSTHVLDAAAGRPAAGVAVTLERRDDGWTVLATAVTDDDGRVRDFGPVHPGVHRLTFDTSAHSAFYPEVAVAFVVAEEGHHHVPLLLSPFAYSTYRGS